MQARREKETRSCSLRQFQVLEGGKVPGSKNKEEQEALATIEGYAAVFNSEAEIGDIHNGGWIEIIDPGAFSGCDMSDTCLKYNHSDNVPILARVRNKSLTLAIDSKGLKIRAALLPTSTNKDIYLSIKSGLLDKMSFAFCVPEGGETITRRSDGVMIRRINKISYLADVAIVDVPAYGDTSISARRKEEQNERRKALTAAAALMRWKY